MEYKRSETAMLAINRFIVIFDFRDAKISSEFPASEAIKRTLYIEASLRAGSLVWVGDKEPRTGEPGEKNEARKSEPARELWVLTIWPENPEISV